MAPAAASVFGRLRGPLVAAWAGLAAFIVQVLAGESGALTLYQSVPDLGQALADTGNPLAVAQRLLEPVASSACLFQLAAWVLVAAACGAAFAATRLEQRLWWWSAWFSAVYVLYAVAPAALWGATVDLWSLTLDVIVAASVILLPLVLTLGTAEELEDEHLQGY
jgi:hypothetical protein